jgi:hypothetical protein
LATNNLFIVTRNRKSTRTSLPAHITLEHTPSPSLPPSLYLFYPPPTHPPRHPTTTMPPDSALATSSLTSNLDETLSPLEQEVLDEYARLLGNMNNVREGNR